MNVELQDRIDSRSAAMALPAAQTVLRAHGVEVFDIEELATHGGSLRLYAQRRVDAREGCSDGLSQPML